MKDNSPDRRDFLKKTALLALAGLAGQGFSTIPILDSGEIQPLFSEFTLQPLPYSFDALEPHIDKQTMEIHHNKHHQSYVSNLNKAVKEGNIFAPLEELISKASTFPAAIRNNGGGHWNHSFFWKIMNPGGSGTPEGRLSESINSVFTSLDELKKQFTEVALKRFGSGWAWLVVNSEGKLEICSTPNQDNPLMDLSDVKGVPILGLDVWEHAYYLKYQNKRVEYVNAWWNLVNWNEVAGNFALALKK